MWQLCPQAFAAYRWWLRLAVLLSAGVAALLPANAGAQERTDLLVRSSDGTMISVHEWGDRRKPSILLIHGYVQSYLSWERQFRPLSKDFHVVAFDLRGHGDSDKPVDAAFYREAWRWADDVQTVIDATHSGRPTLVGWSMGGRVIMDYLEKYGEAGISSLVFVDVGLSRAPGIASEESAQLTRRLSTLGLSENIAATKNFLAACFHLQPSSAEIQRMMAYNMVVPPLVRRLMLGRPLEFQAALRKVTKPTLVVHGAKDRLIDLAGARYTAGMIPGARLIVYPKAGHSPFFEVADEFNADLISFLKTDAAQGRDK